MILWRCFCLPFDVDPSSDPLLLLALDDDDDDEASKDTEEADDDAALIGSVGRLRVAAMSKKIRIAVLWKRKTCFKSKKIKELCSHQPKWRI